MIRGATVLDYEQFIICLETKNSMEDSHFVAFIPVPDSRAQLSGMGLLDSHDRDTFLLEASLGSRYKSGKFWKSFLIEQNPIELMKILLTISRHERII